MYSRVQQGSEPLVVFHVAAHSPMTALRKQEVNALTKVCAICPHVPLEAAHWVHVTEELTRDKNI